MTTLGREFRYRARHLIFPFLGALVILYFGYHAVQGEHGLIAWMTKSNEAEALRLRVAALSAERAALENNVSRLKPESLDLDRLDERARAVLNLSGADEIILIHPPARR